MPLILIDGATAPPETLMRSILGVPLVLWPVRALLHIAPIDRIAVVTSDAGIAGLAGRHGLSVLPPSPSLRNDPGILLDPLQPFVSTSTVDRALSSNLARVVELQTSSIERLRIEDEQSYELIAALARGLDPEHPCIRGIRALRRPLSADIKAVVCDVDGTLTDGSLVLAGEENAPSARVFNTHDGLGTKLLQHAGVHIAWLSATGSAQSIIARAAQLGVEHVDVGTGPKAPRFQSLCQRLRIPASQVLYLGDDVNDLPPMALAGLSACPADARPEVRARADLVLEAPGGRGAFRELADILLASIQQAVSR